MSSIPAPCAHEQGRLRPSQPALVAVIVLTLAACGGDNTGSAGDDPGRTESGEKSSGVAVEETVAAPEMTGEDGWVELHDMDIPAAGTAVMTIDGTRYDVDVVCSGSGVTSDEHSQLFSIDIRGQFGLDDGRSGYFELRRWVNSEPDSFYPYPGHDGAWLQVVVESHKEEQYHSSTQGGPNDPDPRGESLPLLHAQPDGSFTVDSKLKKMMFHGDALDGPITLAGRCPEAWSR